MNSPLYKKTSTLPSKLIGSSRTILEKRLRERTSQCLSVAFRIQAAQQVPARTHLTLIGYGKRINATIVYVDLVGSSTLVEDLRVATASKVIQAFMQGTTDILRTSNGEVRSFDGDRVMAIFHGPSQVSDALRAAGRAQSFVNRILCPGTLSKFLAIANGGHTIGCVTGIDTGELVAISAGIRGESDISWIGRPANLAAKLSGCRIPGYGTFASEQTLKSLDSLHPKLRARAPQFEWKTYSYSFAGEKIKIYGSASEVGL